MIKINKLLLTLGTLLTITSCGNIIVTSSSDSLTSENDLSVEAVSSSYEEEGIYSGDISISYEENDFTSLEEIEIEQKEWKKFKDGASFDVATTVNGVTTFTSTNPSYADLLLATVDGQNYYNIAGPTNEITPIVAKEFIYSMDIVSEGEFKMVLFASENTNMNYVTSDITNNVCEKMGVYLTFKANVIELTTALGNGTTERCASNAIGAISTNASMTLDGMTSNNIKISLERSTVLNEEDKVMMKLYLNDNLITFRKLVVTNNEDNLGFSLRTEWENGVTDGFSIFSPTPSAFVRLSRGISATTGLGCGFGIVTTNTTTLINFKIYNAE